MSVAVKQVKVETKNFQNQIDSRRANIFYWDDKFNITFINKKSIVTLKPLTAAIKDTFVVSLEEFVAINL
jgi:hypothetical protein